MSSGKRARVYSYLRFSDSRQATGSSADRQLEYARRWALEHELELDSALSMRDEGLSAYHQRHIKQGALGVFLAAVSEGRIEPGSVLVVEGLDRLSRAEPILAQAQLAQIINAGITVVTASDGRAYNRETLKASPMDLVYSLLVMIRAHEESDTKSKRVRAAIRRQCEQWQAGSYRGLIRNGKDPHWLSWNGERWELVPDIAEGVLAAVELFESGLGATRVLRELERRGLRFTRGAAAGAQLYKTVRLAPLVGDKILRVDGETYTLQGYYPALIERGRFERLQALVNKRQQLKGRGDIVSVISGNGIARCGYCGAALAAQNMMHRRRADGSISDGHRRLICSSYSHTRACHAGSCSVVPVERALMRYCSDQMNLSALLQGSGRAEQARARVATVRAELAATERQLEKLTEALMLDDGPTPIVFVRKARELEQQLAGQRQAVADAEHELAAVASVSEPALAEAWAVLVDGVEALDSDARLKARQLVMDTFEKVVLYTKGVDADSSKEMDLLLVPKGGAPRLLRINRRTGEWRQGVEFSG